MVTTRNELMLSKSWKKCLYILEYYNLHRILTFVNFRAECVAVDCGKPGSINNGRYHGTETVFGNSWSLICDEGHLLE